MSRARISLIVAVVLVVGGAGAVVAARGSRDPEAGTDPGAQPVTVAIRRMNLSQSRSLSGQLGYGPTRPVMSHAAGTLTWLPRRGSVVTRGGVLFRVNDIPVVVFYGRTPLFRDLGGTPSEPGTPPSSSSSESPAPPEAPDPPPVPAESGPVTGPDVAVLRSNLVALGVPYATYGDELSSGTVAAIKAWQQSTGVEVTGTVDPATVLVLPGPARIESRLARVGDDAGQAPVLNLTSTERQVSVQLDADDAPVQLHTAVKVTLPTGKTIAGRVRGVSKEAVTADGDSPTGGPPPSQLTLTVGLLKPGSVGAVESGPSSVLVPGKVRRHVLTVPVTALLALQEGGYAVQVVTGQTSRLVGVSTGMFADGRVEISGAGLKAGQLVETAS